MDLGTVRSRLNRAHFNHYQIVEEFVADIQLVFSNCDTFNPVSCCNIFLLFIVLYQGQMVCILVRIVK